LFFFAVFLSGAALITTEFLKERERWLADQEEEQS